MKSLGNIQYKIKIPQKRLNLNKKKKNKHNAIVQTDKVKIIDPKFSYQNHLNIIQKYIEVEEEEEKENFH